MNWMDGYEKKYLTRRGEGIYDRCLRHPYQHDSLENGSEPSCVECCKGRVVLFNRKDPGRLEELG